jgi:hypothetical protein
VHDLNCGELDRQTDPRADLVLPARSRAEVGANLKIISQRYLGKAGDIVAAMEWGADGLVELFPTRIRELASLLAVSGWRWRCSRGPAARSALAQRALRVPALERRLTESVGEEKADGCPVIELASGRGRAGPLPPARDKTFKIRLMLNGLAGSLEIAGGILLLFLSPRAIGHLARTLFTHELCKPRTTSAPGICCLPPGT